MARTGGAASWYSINPKVDMKISQNVCVSHFHDVSRKRAQLGSAAHFIFRPSLRCETYSAACTSARGKSHELRQKSTEKVQIHWLASTEKHPWQTFLR